MVNGISLVYLVAFKKAVLVSVGRKTAETLAYALAAFGLDSVFLGNKTA
jgi:hypothetical protein